MSSRGWLAVLLVLALVALLAGLLYATWEIR